MLLSFWPHLDPTHIFQSHSLRSCSLWIIGITAFKNWRSPEESFSRGFSNSWWIRAGPMAEWLSSHARLQRPRVSSGWILGANLAPLIKPCWGSIPHSRTRMDLRLEYTTMYWGALRRRRRRKKKRLATNVSSGPIKKNKTKNSWWIEINCLITSHHVKHHSLSTYYVPGTLQVLQVLTYFVLPLNLRR